MPWKLLLFVVAAIAFIPRPLEAHDENHADEAEHEEEPGHIRIPEERLERLGLRIAKARPAAIVQGVRASGRLVPVDSRLAHVSPRFSGVIKQVLAEVGERVEPGRALAVLQNNQNLQPFQLTPAIAGLVIKRHAVIGEVATEADVLFVVADLAELWAELAIYKPDVGLVAVGQTARVWLDAPDRYEGGEVIFVSPITEEKTQTRLVRVRLKTPPAAFSPGAFVNAVIGRAETSVPLAVEASAVQQIAGKSTLFIRAGEELLPRTIVTGRSDEQMVEVLEGLKAEEEYAAGDTFILKAELGKGAAEHEH